ncbi:MAG: hypothetical protein ACFB12_00695 [Leptolyngbyaceae cyanobacterium]
MPIEPNETVGSGTMGPLLDSFNDAHDMAGGCRQDMLKVSLVKFALANTDSFLHFSFALVPGLRTDNFLSGFGRAQLRRLGTRFLSNSLKTPPARKIRAIPNGKLQIHHFAFPIPIPKISCDNAQKLKIRVGHYGEIGFGLGNGQNCSEAAG